MSTTLRAIEPHAAPEHGQGWCETMRTDDPRLAAFVARHAPDSFYHQPAWLELIAGVYGYRIVVLSAVDPDGELRGVLPLCLMKSPLRGTRVVGLPFSDQCPLVATDDAAAGRLVDTAISLARASHASLLELRTGDAAALGGRDDLARDDHYVRWVVRLAGDSKALWSDLRKPVQRQIRKAGSLGVSISLAQNREDLLAYYQLHLRTRTRKHGLPAQPRRHFLTLWDSFSRTGGVRVLLARHEGTIIAGLVLLVCGRSVRYAYGASDERYLGLAPNNLLMWMAISWACDAGFREFDLGRTARSQTGLMEYKRRWPAIEEPLPYFCTPGKVGLASRYEGSGAMEFVGRIWRRLPLPVAEIIGSRLYRHLG